jgi:hypothetical protein
MNCVPVFNGMLKPPVDNFVIRRLTMMYAGDKYRDVNSLWRNQPKT